MTPRTCGSGWPPTSRRPAAALLAIAHNGNLSNGAHVRGRRSSSAEPIDRDYAETRARWEPLCGGHADQGHRRDASVPVAHRRVRELRASGTRATSRGSQAKTKPMLRARVRAPGAEDRPRARGEARRQPVQVRDDRQHRLAHRARHHDEEDNFFGKVRVVMSRAPSGSAATCSSTSQTDPKRLDRRRCDLGASGLAAVWARDNTREAIFDAMDAQGGLRAPRARGCSCASSRGWDFAAQDLRALGLRRAAATPRACRWAATSRPPPRARRRRFLVRALRDPTAPTSTASRSSRAGSTRKGEAHEKVYDVAWSGDRKPGKDGKLPPVGNTVNVADATYTNSIGAPVPPDRLERPGVRPEAARLLLRARDRDPDARAGRPTT